MELSEEMNFFVIVEYHYGNNDKNIIFDYCYYPLYLTHDDSAQQKVNAVSESVCENVLKEA